MPKKDVCSFSGLPVHPGHGKRYVPSMVQSTKPVLPFVTSKARALYLKKRNPRDILWTMISRKAHKKGTQEEAARRRVRKSRKTVTRGYVGVDYDAIQARRTEKRERPADKSAMKKAAMAELKARKDKMKKVGKK
eukprot:TRINITY_DN606_c0_g1_i1.p1 TRINITY_DN606_c0_g1~~TRINITY_DN606_c0_g1_i1.p1  ORF type:complete len:135 (+),score=54.09 TRINITY_DN606_c0_g1_i1:70-474(+)